MKIIIIGASKGIGRQAVITALDQSHTVTAFSRHPERLKMQHPNLRLLAGNVLDAPSVEAAIKDQDAVICTLGLPTSRAIGPPFGRPSLVLSSGTKNILKAMAAKGVKRLICVTAIGTGDSTSQCTPLARLVFRRGLFWLFQEKDRQEEFIKNTALDWTIIRPTALTNGPRRGTVISENIHSGVFTQISRADVAARIIKIIDQPKTYKKTLAISYPPRIGDSIRWLGGYLGI